MDLHFVTLASEKGASPVSTEESYRAASPRMLGSETTQRTPARLECRISVTVSANPFRPRSREYDKIDRRVGAIDPASASRLARGPWAIALGERRHHERILGRQRACAGFLVVLVELCRKVHRFADDRVFDGLARSLLMAALKRYRAGFASTSGFAPDSPVEGRIRTNGTAR
jgi:hypothetical protein